MPLKINPQQDINTYNSPQARFNAVLSTSRPAGARRVAPSRLGGIGSVRNETLDDLEVDEEFQRDGQIVLEYLGSNDDTFEMLRDSDYNIVQGINRAMTAGNWPPEVQQAYGRVRTRFDNADTGSFNQYLEATKDIGIDLISDPTLLLSLLAAPFTGGASVAARQAAVEAGKVGIKRLAASRLGVLGAAEGFAWGGTDAWARQKTAEQVGISESVNGSKIMAAAVVGGLTGGLIGTIMDRRALASVERTFSETTLADRIAGLDDDVLPVNVNSLVDAFNKATGHTVGRAGTVINTMVKNSPTAAAFQKKLNFRFGRKFSNPFDPKVREVAEPDLFQNIVGKQGKYLTRFKEIMHPITFSRKGRLKQDMNDAMVRAVRNPEAATDSTVKKAALEIRSLLDDMADEQIGLDLIQQRQPNYFPREWLRKSIKNNPDDFTSKLLAHVDEVNDTIDADSVVQTMLDKNNQLSTPAGHLFSAARKFTIKDDNVFEEYLNSDFNQVMTSYILQSSKKVAAVETFGVKTFDEFVVKWTDPIARELKDRGITMSQADRENMKALYKNATGDGLEYFGGFMQGVKDTAAVAFQMAMLPLATLSSLSEVIIPLTKVSTPTYLKSLAQGMGAGFELISKDLFARLKGKHNMSTPQIWKELNENMLALDHATGDFVERLSGAELRNPVLMKAQNVFFMFNLLTPWTRIVQATAFISGKGLIRDNLTALAKQGVDAGSSKSIKMINELADLGIDYKEGIKWVSGGFDEAAGGFYDQVKRGAANFTNGIILPTNRESGNLPHIMNHPKADILTQFLNYPAAFTNVILKGMATDLAEHPVRGGAKILAAGAIITEIGRYGNWVRTRGASEEEGVAEARINGLIRAGGNGLIVDMFQRAQTSIEITGSPLAGAAGFGGPIIGEVVQALSWNKGFAQIAGGLLPGRAAANMVLGRETMDDFSTWLRDQDKKLMSRFIGSEKVRKGRPL